MRKYRWWLRRAQAGQNGYGVLYPVRSGPKPAFVRRGPVPVGGPGPRRRRRGAVARQRRALLVIVAGLAAPALVALATGSATAWWVVLALLPVACTYLAVMFRARRLMAEREINIAFFGSSGRAITGLEEVFSGRYEPLENVGAGAAAGSGGFYR